MNPKKDRILHSSFYMHKLHNRASTSIQKSADKISFNTSALGDN